MRRDNRPAKERLAVFRDCRMAGFWFSKIELFAGSPSEKRLRWRVTFFPDERDGPRLSLSPLDTFDGLRAGMLGAARRAGNAGTGHAVALICYSVPYFR